MAAPSDSAEVQQRAAVQLMPEDLTLKVEVVAARGLAASDLDGSANPYVKLTYGSSMRQTQVVRDSLAPSFQHQVVFPLGGRQQSLRVECLNFDCLRGIDDSLGFALVEIGRVLERGEKEYQVKVKLQDARADLFSGDGEVLLRISR